MKKQPTFRSLGPFSVQEITNQSVLLAGKNCQVTLSVLSEDLFRIHLQPKALEKNSWAVVKTEWPLIPVQIDCSEEKVTLATEAGMLNFPLSNGLWKLNDPKELKIIHCKEKGMGLARQKANLQLELALNEKLFGLGETTGTWNKRGLVRNLWNVDVLGHAKAIYPGMKQLYVSIPFLIFLNEGRASAIFVDNPAKQTWDMGQTDLDGCNVEVDAEELDLYLFLGPSLREIMDRFTQLTGRTPMPPRWALGYHQSRYSYMTRERVEEIAREFRERMIPCDVIHLDIDHMDGYRVFTFGKTFPKPAQMIASLREEGFRVVNIVDPGVKNDKKFKVHQRGERIKAFIKAPKSGKDYVGKVWPGAAKFPDFTRASVRAWWAEEQKALLDLGVSGVWNDMNEPANFALPTKTLPLDCLHQTDFGPFQHRDVHNVYGMEMARASRDGFLTHGKGRRPFVISRAGYAGIQRYAMLWTGDNSSAWEHLAESLQMLLSLSMSGVAFCGSDAGGFIDPTTGELLARWMQMAAFTPFFRNHTNIATRNQEPWAFGPEIEEICRKYIELRYMLLPYIYSLFVETTRSGAPIIRPLAWHYQNDPVAVSIDDQFLLGPDLLVAPILRQGALARSVYLPAGQWSNFETGQLYSGRQHVLAQAALDSIPLFIRAGAIIPMSPLQQHTSEAPREIVNLQIWPGAFGHFHWYDDDGETLSFLEGESCERGITLNMTPKGFQLKFGPKQGSFQSSIKSWRIIVRETPVPYNVLLNGKKIPPGEFVPNYLLYSVVVPDKPAEMILDFVNRPSSRKPVNKKRNSGMR